MDIIAWVDESLVRPADGIRVLARIICTNSGAHAYEVCHHKGERWYKSELHVIPQEFVVTHWAPLSEPEDLNAVRGSKSIDV